MAKTTEPKKVSMISEEAVQNRLSKMLALKKRYLKRINEEGYDNVIKEAKLQNGNSKTGINCRTVSLIPIHDCVNCSGCARLCYDLRNDCIYPQTLNDRARNSALREADPVAFWKNVGYLVRSEYVMELRINVGGDLRYEDFEAINEYVAKENPKCDILFFTKNYDGINKFIDENEFYPNVKAIMSRWIDMECDNKHNLPCSHVLWANGRTTAPEYGAVYCGGNCSECHFNENGCWNLKKGENVIFMAH